MLKKLLVGRGVEGNMPTLAVSYPEPSKDLSVDN